MKRIGLSLLLLSLFGLAACGGGGGGGGSGGGGGGDPVFAVSITEPAGGAVVSGVVRLAAAATGGEAVSIAFTLDDAPVGAEDLTAPFEILLDTALHADGDHTVRVTARDASGGTATASIVVRIANSAPPSGVLTWNDLADGLSGTFAIPQAQEPGTEFRFGYSSAVHAQLENGNLLVAGHPWYDRQAEVAPPATLDGSEAARVGAWFDLTGGRLPTGWIAGEPAYLLGGLLQIGGRIHFTKHQWYDGSGADWETQGFREGGTVRGMWKVAGTYAHHSRVGGYLSSAPAAVRADGYTHLAGLEGTSGAALGRWGPNLFAIQADGSVPDGGSLPSRPLLCHDSEAHAPAGWWIGDKVSSAVWIETEDRHAVLLFLYQKLGATWYGDGVAGGDPYGGDTGYHAEGYELKAWIYDPADLLAVYRGEREPWSLTPVEETVLTRRAPGSAAETHHSFLTGRAIDELQVSVRDGRLIILQPDGYHADPDEGTPKGYALQLP